MRKLFVGGDIVILPNQKIKQSHIRLHTTHALDFWYTPCAFFLTVRFQIFVKKKTPCQNKGIEKRHFWAQIYAPLTKFYRKSVPFFLPYRMDGVPFFFHFLLSAFYVDFLT